MSGAVLAPIGVTVIGGFLGAGKTTLLNQWLAQPQARRLAVLVNDFGAVNVDQALVLSQDARSLALSNGCVCCSIGDDLGTALIGLIESDPPPERIVIEASGVADPGRIAQVALADPALRLDGVLVLADASAVGEQLDDPLLHDTVLRQLRAADLLLLNRAEDLPAHGRSALHRRLDDLLPHTPMLVVSPGADTGALASTWLGQGGVHAAARHAESSCGCGHDDEPTSGHGHGHSHGPASRGEPVDHREVFETWHRPPGAVYSVAALRALLRQMPAGVVRLKGLIATDALGLAELQFAGRRGSLRPAQPGVTTDTGLVVIGLRGQLPAAALAEALSQAESTMTDGAAPATRTTTANTGSQAVAG